MATPFTLILMVQLLKYGQDMNSQLLAEVPTSTAVSDTSLLKETLKIIYIRHYVPKPVRHLFIVLGS